jgi:hypothetical protein
MNHKIFIWGLIFLFFVSCTTSGPKEIFTTDRSTGDVVVPVEYLGGLETLNKKTKGTLYVTETSTRFISEKGTVHLDKPTSSIGSVYIKDEVKLNLGKTALRYLLLGPFALLIKDKSELFSLEFKEDEESSPIYTIFKIKVGTGNTLKSAVLRKQELAIVEEPIAENFEVKNPEAKRPVARVTVIEKHWEEAKASDTISAYEDFIRKHAHTEFTEKARLRLRELFLEQDWENTKASDSIPKYEQFLVRNPNSKFAEEARSRLDRLKEEKLTNGKKKEASREREIPKTSINKDWQTDPDAFARLFFGNDLSKEFAEKRTPGGVFCSDEVLNAIVGAQIEWSGVVDTASLEAWVQIFGSPLEIRVMFGPEKMSLIHITGSRREGEQEIDWKEMVERIEPGTNVRVKMEISREPVAVVAQGGLYCIMLEGKELEIHPIGELEL